MVKKKNVGEGGGENSSCKQRRRPPSVRFKGKEKENKYGFWKL